MKKILCFICAFTLGFFSLFNIKTNSKSFMSAFAYDNTYNYNAEVLSDYNSMGNYSIDSVKSLSYMKDIVYKITISSTSKYATTFLSLRSTVNRTVDYYSTYNAFIFNSYDSYNETLNFVVVSDSYIMHSPNGYNINLAINPNTTVTIYFSHSNLNLDSNFNLEVNTNIIDSGLFEDTPYSYLFDMDSDTNFTFNYYEHLLSQQPDELSRVLVSLLFGGSFSGSSVIVNSSSDTLLATKKGDSLVSLYSNVYFLSADVGFIMRSVVSSTISNNNNGVNIYLSLNEIHVKVYRPVSRINNTLVMYVYDFPQLISNVRSLYYSLARGNDLYEISYLGSLPNSYFIYIFNQDIQNTLFDEYIDVYFNFNSNSLISFDYNSDDNSYSCSLGFDFNYTYYSKPLVSSNSVYSYNFTKPSYVSMEFSLTPLYIPVLEAVENVFIFLLFYSPIISDILELLHLSEFIGTLLTVINYYSTGVLGTFITALISFLIFYLFFKSIMPTVSSGVGSMVDNSQFIYNREEYKKFLGKDKLSKRKAKYKKYETKRIDKSIKKATSQSNKILKRSEKDIDKRR